MWGLFRLLTKQKRKNRNSRTFCVLDHRQIGTAVVNCHSVHCLWTFFMKFMETSTSWGDCLWILNFMLSFMHQYERVFAFPLNWLAFIACDKGLLSSSLYGMCRSRLFIEFHFKSIKICNKNVSRLLSFCVYTQIIKNRERWWCKQRHWLLNVPSLLLLIIIAWEKFN